MTKIVAGATIAVGECGNDDVTSLNLEQMADTLTSRPPTDADRRELVEMLRWLAKLVRGMEDRQPGGEPVGHPDHPPAVAQPEM